MSISFHKSLLIGAVLVASLPAGPALAAGPLTSYQIDQVLNRTCVGERSRAEDAAGRRGENRSVYTNWARQILGSNIDDAEIQRMHRQIYPALSGGNSDMRDIAEFQTCVLDAKVAFTD